MAKNTSVTLGAHFDTFIGRQLDTGRYGSASEIMRAGLRLLEEREARLAALQAALIDGEQSGVSRRTADDILAAAERKHAARNG